MQDPPSRVREFHPVDILIVTALPEEKAAVLDLLSDFAPVPIGDSAQYYGCGLPLGERDCRIAVTQLSRMGNVEAAAHTGQAIRDLDPACVLMVGIAAGIEGRVDLGDVIICDQVFYYEQTKQTPAGPQVRPLVIPSDRTLYQAAQNQDCRTWHRLLPFNQLEDAASELPQVRFGPFAVGDEVVADSRRVAELLRLHPKLIGIEMESYGVATAASLAVSRPRFLAIRGVSDFANDQKDDSHRKPARDAAAAFVVGLLRGGGIPFSVLHSDRKGTLEQSKSGIFVAIRHLSMTTVSSESIVASLSEFFLDCDVVEIFVDQTDLYVDDRLADPREAVRRQANLSKELDNLIRSRPNSAVGYFGLAHIPLLFHAGFLLTNKRRVGFFELDRYSSRWKSLQDNSQYPELQVEGLPTQTTEGCGDVIIRVSISNTIGLEDVEEVIPHPVASVHLLLDPPMRDVLVSESQLQAYGRKFRKVLDCIHEFVPDRDRTCIFYAGPVSLAVFFGQLIIHSIDRRIVVYNYMAKDFPRYSWGMEITADPESHGFVVRPNK